MLKCGQESKDKAVTHFRCLNVKMCKLKMFCWSNYWPEHTVGQQLAQGCLQWTGCESNAQPLGYESDTLPTEPLHSRQRLS